MIRFRVLGRLDLRNEQGDEVADVLRRPKLLALLAYLAAAPGFHRRDTVVALLWPELDHSHARSSLRQAVFALRTGLGAEAILSRGEEELGVDQRRVWCDAREFRVAIAEGRDEHALALYPGTLLEGFHLSAVSEFERWVEQAREELQRQACQAAVRLANREDDAGNLVAAAGWTRRIVELSPYDESAVQRLIRSLDRCGDRAGAIHAYEEFEHRLTRDVELQPSADTWALVEEIRGRAEMAGGRTRRTAPRQDLEAAPPIGVSADLASSSEISAPDASVGHRAPRRLPAALGLLGIGLLTAGGLILWSPFAPHGTSTGAASRLAVLPFTNLGPAEDAYFAAGIADEIAARLGSVERLDVIGSATSARYQNAQNRVRAIGRELDVDYVLDGTVRWQRAAGEPARVRVTLRLLSSPDEAQVWAEVYDESLDEIFRVQSDIALKVVQALDLRILETQRRALDVRPTGNLEAYDYYLRANDVLRQGSEERVFRTALRMYERAVELDPQFALAYVGMSRMHSRMYLFHYDRAEERLIQAKKAVDRAFELVPGVPEAHQALGTYYMARLDYERALQEYAAAEAGRPNDHYVYLARAVMRMRRGDFPASRVDFERALQLDPASPEINNNYAQWHDLMRHHRRAAELHARAMALSPTWAFPYAQLAGVYLRGDGDVTRARAVLDEARAVGVMENQIVLHMQLMLDLLDRRYEDALQRLTEEAPEIIRDQFRFLPRPLLQAEVYDLLERRAAARAYYDSARVVLERSLVTAPDDPRLHSALGIAYAGVGRRAEAIREGELALDLLPINKEAYRGYYRAWDLARIYTMVGEHDAAIEMLEHLLAIPGRLTVAWIRLDPTWDPLRADPRFQEVMLHDRAGVGGKQ